MPVDCIFYRLIITTHRRGSVRNPRTTSTDQNPAHTYSSTGIFSVTLTPGPFSAFTQDNYITVSPNFGAYVVRAQNGNIKFTSTDTEFDVNVDIRIFKWQDICPLLVGDLATCGSNYRERPGNYCRNR